MQKVTNLFTRRGFNIESISVGGSEIEGLSRMIFVIEGDLKILEQIMKQLNKLIDVIKVVNLDHNITINRELALIKVKVVNEQKRGEIIQIIDIFKGKVLDVGDKSLTLEITGNPDKVNNLISLLKSFGIKKIARTGSTALERDIK
jgi:acetolactate synthase-1/3 small subunit